MSTAIAYPHLTFDADGGARVEGTRYKVQHLAGEHFHQFSAGKPLPLGMGMNGRPRMLK